MLSVVAVGSPPLSYQWYQGGTALANGGRISGADTPYLTIGQPGTVRLRHVRGGDQQRGGLGGQLQRADRADAGNTGG